MKISLTPFQQTLTGTAILYALDAGFLSTSSNKDKMLVELQKVFDSMSINTPVKSGGCNQLIDLNKLPIL
jgi:hypothetical protein